MGVGNIEMVLLLVDCNRPKWIKVAVAVKIDSEKIDI
jgi:hypothetical protein